MKAELIYRAKSVLYDGSILEMVIWRVPSPVAGSSHDYEYRLFFGDPGHRFVCYDNERGKGDHKHVGGVEQPYKFASVEALIGDFLEEVRRWRERS